MDHEQGDYTVLYSYVSLFEGRQRHQLASMVFLRKVDLDPKNEGLEVYRISQGFRGVIFKQKRSCAEKVDCTHEELVSSFGNTKWHRMIY